MSNDPVEAQDAEMAVSENGAIQSEGEGEEEVDQEEDEVDESDNAGATLAASKRCASPFRYLLVL